MKPSGERKRMIEENFASFAKETFAKHTELASAMLVVAQYWADEADDAVHGTVVFSQRATPLWPHRCNWDEENEGGGIALEPAEQCTSCGDYGWMPFDENGDAIAAFQACCREDASQESSTAEAYLPYAIARASGEIEIIGTPIRAWLDPTEARPPTRSRPDDAKTKELFDLVYAARDDDGPRQVLADWLVEHDDPLGAYITSALQGSKTPNAELEEQHGRSWLGPIADVAPAERVAFDRGFVRALAVHLADDAIAARVIDAREWGTVEELRFLPQSKQRLSTAMRSLRDVGPLDASGLAELGKIGPKLGIERAHVVVADDAMMNTLATLDLASLRVLTIGSTYGGPGVTAQRGRNPFTGEEMEIRESSLATANLGPSVLAPLRRAPSYARLDELVLASVAPATVDGWLALAENERPRTVTFTSPTPSFETAGFRIRVTGDLAIVDVPSIGGDVGVNVLVAVLTALPKGIRIELAPTRWFEPTDDDALLVSKAAERKVTLASIQG